MKSNIIERTIRAISPRWAVKRRQWGNIYDNYDAATPSRLRRARSDSGSGNALVERSLVSLRAHARYLHRNHDIARGALDTLTNNIVGAKGIGVEPQPMDKDGNIMRDVAKQIAALHKDWCLHPEVTGTMSWAQTQRTACLSWLRDGEVLGQMLPGTIAGLQHNTRVPFSLELLESDYLPLDYIDKEKKILHGVQRNAWGKPKRYYLHKDHPGDTFSFPISSNLKSVPAERILHPKLVDRIGQVRGITILASVMTRLEDINDYEQSERIKAKVLASMSAAIVKGLPEMYEPEKTTSDGTTTIKRRSMKMRAGMIFDALNPGESIQGIGSSDSVGDVEGFRSGQLRAVAAGVGATYSSLAKNYTGTYSAQRQELVEQWVSNAIMSAMFISTFVQPVYRMFITAAIAARQIEIPDNLDMTTIYDAMFVIPMMPWIDPLKEANAFEKLERAGYVSGPEIIRQRGGNPDETLAQEAEWRQRADEKGVMLSTNPANDKAGAQTPEPDDSTGSTQEEKDDDDKGDKE